MLYIWWDIQGIVYYELFKSNESITGNRYQLRLNEALLEKKPAVASNQRKYAFARQYSTTHCKSHRGNTDAARMGSSPVPSVFTRLSSFRLLLVSINAARLGGHTSEITRICKNGSMNGLLRKTNRSIVAESTYCHKDRKNV